MSEHDTYQHEDIESLLMSKAFAELLEEERAFVLQHVKDEAEYTSMRELLLQMHELSFDSDLKDAPESIETALMHGFAENAEKVRGYTRRFSPWMGWAVAATIVGICVVFFWPGSDKQQTAQAEQEQQQSEEKDSANLVGQPTPVIAVPEVTLPSDVERLLAQVAPASIPEAPPGAQRLYEYDEEVKSVNIEEAELSEPSEVPVVTAQENLDAVIAIVEEDVPSKPSAVPSRAQSKTVELNTTTTVQESLNENQVAEETNVSEMPKRKKKRNPDAMNIGQSKRLRSLLRGD